MSKEIFYVLMDDHIVTRQEVELAFYVTHGYHNTRNHEVEFLKWLYALLGKTIKQAIPKYERRIYQNISKDTPAVHYGRKYKSAYTLYRNGSCPPTRKYGAVH